mmetsp:Transcript_4144/g.9967  ORF Transcript_4144/g.9967 Transcript_4144/m.9967 type:complete len:265 (+) Transcript_4144:4666-5460(+)
MWEVQIIQEYCEHGSLRKVLDSKTYLDGSTGLLEAGTMLKIAGDVARGMLHIHGMQIIHGDLKAQNILITSGRGIVAKVADFGLSVHMSHEQTHISGVHAGTLTHMAPEILMCGRISKSADVYAFGILLFEILTGEKAFKGVPAMQLTADVTTRCRRPHFPPGSPKQYAELAARCWEHDPNTRPTFVEVIEALDTMQSLHNKGLLVAYSNMSQETLEGYIGLAQHTTPDSPYPTIEEVEEEGGTEYANSDTIASFNEDMLLGLL